MVNSSARSRKVSNEPKSLKRIECANLLVDISSSNSSSTPPNLLTDEELSLPPSLTPSVTTSPCVESVSKATFDHVKPWLSNSMQQKNNNNNTATVTQLNDNVMKQQQQQRVRKSCKPNRSIPITSKEDSAEFVAFKFLVDPIDSTINRFQYTTHPDGHLARCLRRRRTARLQRTYAASNNNCVLSTSVPYSLRKKIVASDVPMAADYVNFEEKLKSTPSAATTESMMLIMNNDGNDSAATKNGDGLFCCPRDLRKRRLSEAESLMSTSNASVSVSGAGTTAALGSRTGNKRIDYYGLPDYGDDTFDDEDLYYSNSPPPSCLLTHQQSLDNNPHHQSGNNSGKGTQQTNPKMKKKNAQAANSSDKQQQQQHLQQQQGKKAARTFKTVKTHTEKVCLSCRTNQTPIWREVKEQWGEGWKNVLLCNACGLQWRMCSLHCDKCNYVPRAAEKRNRECSRCDEGVWV